MPVLIIVYDLKNADSERYEQIKNAIKEHYPEWYKVLNTTWAIKTDKTVEEVRDHLMPFIEKDDRLLVFIATGVAWSPLSNQQEYWLKTRFS